MNLLLDWMIYSSNFGRIYFRLKCTMKYNVSDYYKYMDGTCSGFALPAGIDIQNCNTSFYQSHSPSLLEIHTRSLKMDDSEAVIATNKKDSNYIHEDIMCLIMSKLPLKSLRRTI